MRRKTSRASCFVSGISQSLQSSGLLQNARIQKIQWPFSFEQRNADYFKAVVNQSVSGFVGGDSVAKVVADLQKEWADLRDDFYNGNLSRRPRAVFAGDRANDNYQRVGGKP